MNGGNLGGRPAVFAGPASTGIDHRLVKEYFTLDDAGVGWDNDAERQLHHIARHQNRGGQLGSVTVALDSRFQ